MQENAKKLAGLMFVLCVAVGEGFKFVSVIGEVLANFVEGKPQAVDIREFSPDRLIDLGAIKSSSSKL